MNRKISSTILTAGLGLGTVLGLGFTQAQSASATAIVKSKSNITNNRMQSPDGTAAPAPTSIRRYPPNGYPCLGCHPCPPSFCDNDNNMVVWNDPTGGTLVRWFVANATA